MITQRAKFLKLGFILRPVGQGSDGQPDQSRKAKLRRASMFDNLGVRHDVAKESRKRLSSLAWRQKPKVA